MALITRISRLFRADFNAVLDRIEEPDVLLKQALREMQDDLHTDTHQLKISQKEYSQVEKNIYELQQNIKQVNEELDICFDSNETELARRQVKRKLEIQRYEKHLKNKLNSVAERISELESRIDENKTRFITMQQKLELFVNDESKNNEEGFSSTLNVAINDNEVEMAFLREKQARSAS